MRSLVLYELIHSKKDPFFAVGFDDPCSDLECSTLDLLIANTIFEAGVSTAEKLTDVSGRGVGMDAVSAELKKLGADIKIEFTAETLPSGRRPFRFSIECPTNMTSH